MTTNLSLPSGQFFDPPLIVLVTPQLASEWLVASNTCNRNLRADAVAKIARDMSRGEFRYTADPIKFGKSGSLLDGQHRLAAVVKSGVATHMVVARNLDDDVRDVVDSGTARTMADRMKMRGIKDSSLMASVAHLVVHYQGGDLQPNRRYKAVSPTEIFACYEKHEVQLVEAAHQSRRWRGSKLPPGPLAFCVWRFNQVSPEACHEFFETMFKVAQHEAGLERGHPIIALLRRLDDYQGRYDSTATAVRVGMVFRAWNAWRQGHSRVALKDSANGKLLSVPEPV